MGTPRCSHPQTVHLSFTATPQCYHLMFTSTPAPLHPALFFSSPDVLQSAHFMLSRGLCPASLSFNGFTWISFLFFHRSLMNNWKDCSICQMLFEGSVLESLTWRHITLSGSCAAAEHLWLRLSCSDSNFPIYLAVTSDLNVYPQRILHLLLQNYVSALVSACCWWFWMLWVGCRCTPNIISH